MNQLSGGRRKFSQMTVARHDYRPDIQGLRALAVLPIVLIHAGVAALPGGFLGVDIFFVISGFLITKIIDSEIRQGSFSFPEFYKRRAVRIFPAFIVMLMITMIAGIFLMIDPIFDKNAISASFSLIFTSNIYFWRTADYFSPAAHIYMYLHTWSLGIEEQFYLLYPIVLVVLYRIKQEWVGKAVWLVIGCSLIASFLFYNHASGWAFFLLPSRAWQLGFGAAVALGQFPTIANASGRAGVAIAGLIMICASLVFIDQTWQIPAPWSLPASLGAALLIAYGDRGPTAVLFSLSPLAWIGTISYSLYLWHWPILVLYHIALGPVTDAYAQAALIGGSVAVAAVSYYVVEQPFLKNLRHCQPVSTVVISGTIMGGLAIATFGMSKLPDTWSSFPPEARRVAAYYDYARSAESEVQLQLYVCFSGLGPVRFDTDYCTRQLAGKPTIALVGDSHAAQYSLAIRQRYPNHNIIQVTAAGCYLLVKIKSEDRCNQLNELFFDKLAVERRIDRVILVNQWKEKNLGSLHETIRFLRQKEIAVTVIGPVEEFRDSVPLLLANALKAGSALHVGKHRLVAPVALENIMAKRVLEWGADYYSVQAIECPNRVCRYFAPDGVPIHHDYGHVTQSGAAFLLSRLPH